MESSPTDVREATKSIVLEKLAIQRETLRRNDLLVFYAEIASLSTALVCALMISYAYKKKLSIHVLELRSAKIPMREKDLPKALPVVYDLALAEKMEQNFPEKAFALYEKMAAMRIKELDALTVRGRLTTQTAIPEKAQEAIDDRPVRTPTFRELFHNGAIEEGGDLLCGFSDVGEPQSRSLDDLKAVAVVGWQGSGKTLSMAYLTACSLIQESNSVAYVIDPHNNHKEGLGNILKPLENTGRLIIVKGFEVGETINNLNKILDDRLTGKASSKARILLVVDELARLSGLDCFNTLMDFIERCTNEIRKANILFIAGSTKWTARHFKGRADIRGTMPSSLVHHTKVSQAKLILEDMDKDTKALLRQVERPGTALLSTSSRSDPSLIHIPLITPADICEVVDFLKVANGQNVSSETFPSVDKCCILGVDKIERETIQPPSNVVKFQPVDKTQVNEKSTAIQPVDKNNEESQEIIEKLRKEINEKRLTLGEISRLTKVDKSWLSKIINGGKVELMSENIRQKLRSLF